MAGEGFDDAYQRLRMLTVADDEEAARSLISEAARRGDPESVDLALETLTDRFNTRLGSFIALHVDDVGALRVGRLPDEFVQPEWLDCLRKVEARFFDIENGGVVGIIEENSEYDFRLRFDLSRQLNQQQDQEVLRRQGPTWEALRWPVLLQKLLEKRVFEVGEGEKRIGSMLEHAADMVYGGDAIGYYDRRERQSGILAHSRDFEFEFIDGADPDGIREPIAYCKGPDGSVLALRPDMSQDEMNAFMGGLPFVTGVDLWGEKVNWRRENLFYPICDGVVKGQEGWDFCTASEISTFVGQKDKPYTLPIGRTEMTGNLAACKVVMGTEFVCWKNRKAWATAILRRRDRSSGKNLTVVQFNIMTERAGLREYGPGNRAGASGAVRLLRG